LSDQALTLPTPAVCAAYAAAGHPDGSLLALVPVSGRESPNVIDLAAARARRKEARKSDVD
jgi:hypothetical protein